MKLNRQGLAVLVVTIGAFGAAIGARGPSEANIRLADAASAFLKTLRPELRERAGLRFDHPARTDWHIVPRDRVGVNLGEMNAPERSAAHALIRAALSGQGYLKADAIMKLDGVLLAMEQDQGRVSGMRDPERYALAVYGEPAPDRPWGWRIEGHHLSLHITAGAGDIVATSPAFMGANPAEVRSGPSTGLRVLAAEEDLARELLASFTPEQRAKAVFSATAPPDVVMLPGRGPEVLDDDVGLAASEMTGPQRDRLTRLIEEYARNLRPDLEEQRLARVRKGGIEHVRFGWAGATEPGKPHYYRVRGPKFIIEYDNTQNDANHVHTLWRDPELDFGDALLEHYRRDHPSR